jgi:short-subunit dehydrogenase
VTERGQHIVITGASSGIGAALAEAYAKMDARLTLFARNAEKLSAVAARCAASGATAAQRIADVTDDPEMRRLLMESDDALPIDILIANAGTGGNDAMAPPSGEDAATVARVLATNVLGTASTVAPLVSRFVARGRGHIVIVSSLAGILALPDTPAYSASKAAIRTYGHALRRLVAGSGVKVSVVCPGFVETPMSATLPFRGPFAWSAEKAAVYIVRGIARGKREIIFPWPLALAVGLTSYLPMSVADFFLRRIRGATLAKTKP